jgi:hypothetical protein
MAYDLSKTNNDTDYHSDIDFSADFEKRHCRRNTAHHVSKRVTWNVGGDRGTMRRQRQSNILIEPAKYDGIVPSKHGWFLTHPASHRHAILIYIIPVRVSA